jgi:hypothetical protein
MKKRLSVYFDKYFGENLDIEIQSFYLLGFAAGGYKSGMPCFFIFAFVYTAIMLAGKDRAAALVTLFVIYLGCCVAADIRHEYGLFICHQIVHSHGGEIWIESVSGRGTSVCGYFSHGRPAGLDIKRSGNARNAIR